MYKKDLNLDVSKLTTCIQRSEMLVFKPSGLSNISSQEFDLEGKPYGACGFHFYPPWTSPTSKQAQLTQKWQLRYFLDVSYSKLLDVEKAQDLFSELFT